MDSIIETCKSTCAACELSRTAPDLLPAARETSYTYTHTRKMVMQRRSFIKLSLRALWMHHTYSSASCCANFPLQAARCTSLRLARFLNYQLRAGEASTQQQQPQQSINYIPRNPSPCDVVEPPACTESEHPGASAFCHAWKVLKAVSGTAEHKIAADGIEVLLRRRNL